MSFFSANAQDLYTSAYERYVGGAFAQAAGTARTATSLARIAALLMTDPSAIGRGGSYRGGRHGGMMDPRGGKTGQGWPDVDRRDEVTDDLFDPEDQAPVTVPAPEF